jgi:hypothetical protein
MFDVFNEHSAYVREYNFNEFPEVNLNKVFSPEHLVEDTIVCRYYEFLEQKTSTFVPVTFGELIYIGSSLSRCFIAHLIDDEQRYFECTDDVFHDPVKFDFSGNKLDDFSRSILSPPGLPSLELESLDPAIIHAIELRFVQAIIVSLGTFDIKPHIERIYQNLQNKRTNTSANKARASRVAFGDP